jgi:hypothetical protein
MKRRHRVLKALLVFLLSGGSGRTPRSVQVVVPDPDDDPIQAVELSPGHDKLIYVLHKGKQFLMDLRTGETKEIGSFLGSRVWVDNETVFFETPSVLVSTQDLSTTPVLRIDAREQSIDALLAGNQTLFHLTEIWPNPEVYLVVSNEADEAQHYYIFNMEWDAPALRGASIREYPPYWQREVQHRSPDGAYYFEHFVANYLRMYRIEDDELVREVRFDSRSQVLGWAYDSSGVIYRTSERVLPLRSHPVLKLTVPDRASQESHLLAHARRSLRPKQRGYDYGCPFAASCGGSRQRTARQRHSDSDSCGRGDDF